MNTLETIMQPVRKIIAALSLLTLSLLAAAATGAEAAGTPIVVGEQRAIFSRVLNEERTVLVSKPSNYDRGDERYPVIIVLSAGMFAHTSALVRFMADEQLYPDALVVAIVMTSARTRDLTPAASDPAARAQVPTGGGAANFRSFIASELLPWLDANYRTRPYRVLVGHSYGGLFAIDTLFAQPELFNSYVAISPSLWWDAGRLVARAEEFFRTPRAMSTHLYLSTSSGDSGELRGSVQKFAGVLEARAPQGLSWLRNDFAQQTHDSGALPGTHQGLDFVFSDWALRDAFALYDAGGIDAVERFFERRNRVYGLGQHDVAESTLQSVAGTMLERGKLDELYTLLGRYRDRVRPPASAYLRFATALREQGQRDRAIELYRRALETDSKNTAARKALAELGVDYP